ncbi:MAG: TlyA family RNA methyltransferase [Anaerolineae bacterium]|nr:TlyA family RNA methyltransferase [Anaerolineae bacterium]
MEKVRLDMLLVDSGKAESRNMAQRMIMAGQVRVDGQVVLKPSTRVLREAQIEVVKRPRYVSRGGEKLEAALTAFGMEDLSGWICADVGASTGGFSDCLLQHGAARVYAIDVGYGVLHWKLRNDPRLVIFERTNARYVERLAEPVDLITVDASFISLGVLLPVIKHWLVAKGGHVIALIKPQFEAGQAEAARGEGVIRDAHVHRKVVEDVLCKAVSMGYEVKHVIKSPLLGPKGNVEFFAWLSFPEERHKTLEELSEQIASLFVFNEFVSK